MFIPQKQRRIKEENERKTSRYDKLIPLVVLYDPQNVEKKSTLRGVFKKLLGKKDPCGLQVIAEILKNQ